MVLYTSTYPYTSTVLASPVRYAATSYVASPVRSYVAAAPAYTYAAPTYASYGYTYPSVYGSYYGGYYY